jgi:hypothetical protein
MPFELGGALRGGAEWTCGSPLLYGVLRNPVFTAALITALALVIIFALYRAELKRSGWQLGVKTAFWVLVATSAVVFVHYYALEKYFSKEHSNRGVREVVGSIHASAVGGGGYRVPLPGEEGEARRDPYPGESRRPAKPARRHGAGEDDDEEEEEEEEEESSTEEGDAEEDEEESEEGSEASVFKIQDAVLPSSRAPGPTGGASSHRKHKEIKRWKEAAPREPKSGKKHKGRHSKPWAPYRR